MYFATTASTTIPSSTEVEMENALKAYITQPYASDTGKVWINHILDAFNQ